MATLACTKCRYTLYGLPAAVCKCGHICIRCPECGTTVDGNEPRARLLENLRRMVQRLPGFIQKVQIAGMALLGVAWVLIGWSAGVSLRSGLDLIDWFLFAFIAAALSAAVRCLVFRWDRARLADVASWGFIALPWLFGFLAGASAPSERIIFAASPVIGGAALGALASTRFTQLVLYTFLKRDDRRRLTQSSDLTSTSTDQVFCSHCAGDLRGSSVETCPNCGLGRISCTACGRTSPVSTTLTSIDLAADVGSRCWASLLLAIRLFVMFWIVVGSIDIWDDLRRAYLPWRATGVPFTETMIAMAALTFVLRWIVHPGRKLLATWALLIAVLAPTGILALYGHPDAIHIYVQFLFTWIVGGFALIVLAAMMHFAFLAILPKRHVEIVDQTLGRTSTEAAVSAPATTSKT